MKRVTTASPLVDNTGDAYYVIRTGTDGLDHLCLCVVWHAYSVTNLWCGTCSRTSAYHGRYTYALRLQSDHACMMSV